MKNKLLVVLLFLSVLSAYYFFGADYLEQRRLYDSLMAQVAGASQVLAQKPETPGDLEQRLAAAQADLIAVATDFPGKMNSTRVIDIVLKMAEDVGVKAIPLVSQPWSLEKRGEHDYYVLHLNISVSGSHSQLETFTGGLENGELATLIVEQLNVTGVGGEKVSDPASPVTASLDLAIYTRLLPID